MQGIEHSIALYHNICVICGILAAIFLGITIVLFFRLNIMKCINDLSGKNKRKAIKKMEIEMRRENNEKVNTSLSEALNQGKESQQAVDKTEQIGFVTVNETAVLGTNETAVLGTNETAVLGTNETAVLGTNETAVLGTNETAVLGKTASSSLEDVGATMILTPQNNDFVIERQILMINTTESIIL